VWYTEGIRNGSKLLDWSAGYVTPDGELSGAVGALRIDLPPRGAGRCRGYCYYTAGYWSPDQPRSPARASAANVPGVARGESGWSAALVAPTGGAAEPSVDRSPHLYATLADAQAAAEAHLLSWLQGGNGTWPGPGEIARGGA